MISRLLLLVPSFTKKEAFKKFKSFFNNMQIFHPLFSMLHYTGNLGLRYCVGFSQIQSQLCTVLLTATNSNVFSFLKMYCTMKLTRLMLTLKMSLSGDSHGT